MLVARYFSPYGRFMTVLPLLDGRAITLTVFLLPILVFTVAIVNRFYD